MTAPAAPRVSVIIPCYNAAAWVAGALASAMAQTLSDIEILVCDDASTDASAAIVSALGGDDARVRLLRQPVNRGPSAARNRCIAEARGTWLALLDADDSFVPDRLETLVRLAEREDADLCSDNLLLMADGSEEHGTAMIPPAVLGSPRRLELGEFLRRNVADPAYPALNFGFLKPIMRREFLEKHQIRYDEGVRFAEDFALYLACLRAGGRWWMAPDPGYRYRVRSDSLTQVQTVHDLGVLRTRLAGLLAEAEADGDGAITNLVRRHKRVIDRCYHYRAFTDAVKSGTFGAAANELVASPQSARLIAEEALRQVPFIMAKALSGGYFRSRRTSP